MEHGYSETWALFVAALSRAFADLQPQRRAMAVSRKEDGSPLSNADTALQERLLELIRALEPNPCVVGEEEVNTLAGREHRCPRTWVLDPLDGTTQFLDPAGTEYCSTVAVLHGNMPVACLVYCPQLSRTGSEVVISVDGPGQPPMVNNSPAEPVPRSSGLLPGSVSATRARRDPPRSFESKLEQAGTVTKLRATSLSLDMARTCLDLSGPTGLNSFRWFHRADQRAWDGLAGIVLARAAGLAAVDLRGTPLTPLPDGFLEDPEPVFPHTVLAIGDEIGSVLELLRDP